LSEAALRAADHFERGEARPATRALLYAASLVRQTVEEDWSLQTAVDQKLLSRIRKVLKHFRVPNTEGQEWQICKSCQDHNIEGLVANGDWRSLLCEVVKLLEKAIMMQNDWSELVQDGGEDDSLCAQDTPSSQGSPYIQASPCAQASPDAPASPSVCSGLFVGTPTPVRRTSRRTSWPTKSTPGPLCTPGSDGEGSESEEGDSVASSSESMEEDGDEIEGAGEDGDLQGDLKPYTSSSCGGEIFLACAVLLVVFAGCVVSAGLLATVLPALPAVEA